MNREKVYKYLDNYFLDLNKQENINGIIERNEREQYYKS